MLSWDDFRYVKAIADARSLTGAAQSLGVNHSTVFRRLGQIEGQLGSRLFDRRRGGYALTPSGEEMVRLAERMGEEIIAYERRVTGQDLRPSGELRVTTSDMLMVYLVSDVLCAFRHAYPEIVLDVVISNQLLNLSKRDADVAVRATYNTPDALDGRRIARIAWAVFGPASMEGKPFDPESDVPLHSWVGFSENIGVGRASRWLKQRGGDERIVYRVNTLLGFVEAVACGVGIALLPCYVGEKAEGIVRLCPPIPDLAGELWLLSHPDLRNTARVTAFTDFCANEIGKHRAALECTT